MPRKRGLPLEIYAAIVEHVADKPNLLTLSLTSKSLNFEVARVLHRQLHLPSFKAFDTFARYAARKPELCRYTRSFEVRRDLDADDYWWTEERRSSFGILLSKMPFLIRLDLQFEMADEMWSTLTSSTASSGARIEDFRCWLRHRNNPRPFLSFFASQPSITSLQLSSAWESHDHTFSLPSSVLSNLVLLEGFFHRISPFFDDRPIRRLNIHNDDTFHFKVDTHIPDSIEVLRINCCPISFPFLPTIRYLDFVCSLRKANNHLYLYLLSIKADENSPQMPGFIDKIGKLTSLTTLVFRHPPRLDKQLIDSMFDKCASLEVIQLMSTGVEFWRTLRKEKKISRSFDWETWTQEDTTMARPRVET